MPHDTNTHQPHPLEPDKLTWAALLAQWMDFAQQALGLPQDDAGQRLRESVPDIVMLQAVWFALHHLDELPHDQRALGLDRAEVLIDKHTAAIHHRWTNATMPEELHKLIDDARRQLADAQQKHQSTS